MPRSVMFLIPRTASTWCRQAIRNGGIPYREHGKKHGTDLPTDRPIPAFRFCLTRQPRDWLRSRWALGAWEDELTHLWTIRQDEFFEAVSDAMVGMYFAKWTQVCKGGFVGTSENAADDLVKALRECGTCIRNSLPAIRWGGGLGGWRERTLVRDGAGHRHDIIGAAAQHIARGLIEWRALIAGSLAEHAPQAQKDKDGQGQKNDGVNVHVAFTF